MPDVFAVSAVVLTRWRMLSIVCYGLLRKYENPNVLTVVASEEDGRENSQVPDPQ